MSARAVTTIQHVNALLADGALLPGNKLHRAALAGKPGHWATFARCCSSTDGCHCSLEARTVVVIWKRMSAPQRRLFPVGHPFRNARLSPILPTG